MAEIIIESNEPKRLGEYLICSPGTLQNAVKRQGHSLKFGQSKRIGEILVEDGAISNDDLEVSIRRQRKDRLRACPVFANLTNAELSALSMRFKEVTAIPGEQFIRQDEPDPTLYVLASGRVEVYRTDMEGNYTHIAFVEPCEPIGEMGYFQGTIRTASIKATETTQLLQADYTSLTHYFENVPHVAHAFLQIVDQRRQDTEEIMELEARKNA
jgi:CRP-like cAMP-binding protein